MEMEMPQIYPMRRTNVCTFKSRKVWAFPARPLWHDIYSQNRIDIYPKNRIVFTSIKGRNRNVMTFTEIEQSYFQNRMLLLPTPIDICLRTRNSLCPLFSNSPPRRKDRQTDALCVSIVLILRILHDKESLLHH